MAEFVEKRCEDMIPELEQMERIKLFEKNEIRGIAKKRKEYEYKIQRHTKCKEDYLRYIQYEMDLLKLIKQRRQKFGITQKKSDIDYTIANKVNQLYKQAIFKFQDDIRFFISYMKFCKHVRFHSCVSRMMGRMLQVHQDKPKCWHITARWELEESKNVQTARQFLLRGLHHHPDSQLLLADAFKLELDEAKKDAAKKEGEDKANDSKAPAVHDDMTIGHKRALVVYKQALKRVKDVKFIVELLNTAKGYEHSEKLQSKIVSDLIEEYSHTPLMWDTMARRELEGLPQPSNYDAPMEIDSYENISLRDRISACNQVYLTAVKKLKTEEMWSMYIDCMMEINDDLSSLPNYKKKLLKSALLQAHHAKKLREKYYIYWIEMLNKGEKEEAQKRLYEVLSWGTEASPTSVNLWHAKLRYLMTSGKDTEAVAEFAKASEILGGKSLPLWRMRLMDAQTKSPEKVEAIFAAALKAHPSVAKEMKPAYIEWLLLTKGIEITRQVYNDLCTQPPSSLELHKKMCALESIQPEIRLRNARRPHEMATMQFGTKNTDVWMDYIMFEMKHGDPQKVADLHRRAIKTLEPALSDIFVSEYSLIKANPESIGKIP